MNLLDILREEQHERIDSFREIFQRNPNFFMQDSDFLRIVIENDFMVFDYEMDPSEVGDFIDGDYKIGKDSSFFETFLSGDTWDLYEYHFWDGDWESALEYHIDGVREDTIKEHMIRVAQKNNVDLSSEDFVDKLNGMSLEDLINEYDEDTEVIDSIRRSLEECEMESYFKEVKSRIESALSEYGEVKKLNYEGAVVNVNLSEVLNNYYNGNYDEMLEWLQDVRFDLDDYDSIFRELQYEDPYSDKPTYFFDDRWHADIDNANFNSVLSDHLGEFMDDDLIKRMSI